MHIDSRECEEGALFVALAGEHTDGHRFVGDAAERGARAAVVQTPRPADVPQLVVPDPRAFLGVLAARYRRRCVEGFVIGVTGTCGKTTVKEMLARVLASRYDVGRTPGNRNNQLGLPLTLLNRGHGEVLVAELGTNRPGEIEQLTRWLRPHMGVITHVGPAHLDGLGSLRQIVREKGSLLAGLPEDGVAVLPSWLEVSGLRGQSVPPPLTVGFEPGDAVRVGWEEDDDGLRLNVEDGLYHVPLTGEALARDAALVGAIARHLGLDHGTIGDRLAGFEPLPGRGRVHEVGGCRVIDGTYNANPDSMRAALERLDALPPPRLAVLGTMAELGSRAEQAHRTLGARLDDVDALTAFFVGEHGEAVAAGYGGDGLSVVPSVDALPEVDLQQFGSALVKGSRSVGLDRLLSRWRDAA